LFGAPLQMLLPSTVRPVISGGSGVGPGRY